MASKKMGDRTALGEKVPTQAKSGVREVDFDIDMFATEEEKFKAAKAKRSTDEAKKENSIKSKVKLTARKINVSKISSNAWVKRINTVQQERITPEMRERMKKRAKRQQRQKLNARKCKGMQSKTRSNRKFLASAMKSMERGSVGSCVAVSRSAKSKMKSIQKKDIYRDNDFLNRGAVLGPVQSEKLEVDEAVIIADSLAEKVEEAEEVGAIEMEQLLKQLRSEPNTDEERNAMFELYETYHETVCEIRKQTFEFWEECKTDFQQGDRDDEGAVVKSIEKSLNKLDSEDALAMGDYDGAIWFVYGMCKKAAANNDAIQGVLKMIRIKLELLSHQEECPICLEEFDNEHMPQLLICCHKVCDDCWEHWKALRHGRVFCPLCRNEEFVVDVLNLNVHLDE